MSKKNSHFTKKSSQAPREPSLFSFRCKATPSLWASLLLASAVLLGLSYWQFSKGLHRQQLEHTQQQVKQTHMSAATTLESATRYWSQDPWSINDSQLKVQGQFQQGVIVLHDNRVLNRTPGYAIYVPFRLQEPILGPGFEKFNHIMVNIGWHPIPNFDRSQAPRIDLQHDQPFLNVSLEHIDDRVFTLDTSGIQTLVSADDATTYRVQKMQIQELNNALDLQLLPFVGRALTSVTQQKLPAFQNPVAQRGISAAKHFGYSVQWFIFWCIALGVFVYTQCSCYSTDPTLTDQNGNLP